eukprot:Skav215002  [mRNA]  locus=scaffold508:1247060:1247944:+ [translate_table: standard]
MRSCVDVVKQADEYLKSSKEFLNATAYAEAVSKQYAKCIAAIAMRPPTGGEEVTLVGVIASSCFDSDSKMNLMTKVEEMNSFVLKREVRPKYQDFTAFPGYLPQSVWECLGDALVSKQTKQDRVIRFLASLGLIGPNEPTVQMVTAVLLMVTKQTDMSPAEKHGAYEETRDLMSKGLTVWAPSRTPNNYEQVLPLDPLNYNQSWVKLACGDEMPAICKPLSLQRLNLFAITIPMRKTHKSLRKKFDDDDDRQNDKSLERLGRLLRRAIDQPDAPNHIPAVQSLPIMDDAVEWLG